MAFWKKSEDPWDQPARRPETVPVPAEEEKAEPEEGVLDTLRSGWTAHRQKKKAALTKPPDTCPWCGREMEQGYFIDGRDTMYWYRGIPVWSERMMSGPEDRMRVITEGGVLGRYKTVWYCPDCKKMVLDAADMRTLAEEGEPFPVSAGERTESEEKEN